jgi:hypothetical protein
MHCTHLAILIRIVGTRFRSSSKIHPKILELVAISVAKNLVKYSIHSHKYENSTDLIYFLCNKKSDFWF